MVGGPAAFRLVLSAASPLMLSIDHGSF